MVHWFEKTGYRLAQNHPQPATNREHLTSRLTKRSSARLSATHSTPMTTTSQENGRGFGVTVDIGWAPQDFILWCFF